eukprot:294017-Alexandrium_andersonii.AAC.1
MSRTAHLSRASRLLLCSAGGWFAEGHAVDGRRSGGQRGCRRQRGCLGPGNGTGGKRGEEPPQPSRRYRCPRRG